MFYTSSSQAELIGFLEDTFMVTKETIQPSALFPDLLGNHLPLFMVP